ncbi:MAG: crossover junction endodeoxyribonuclease RuvC [Thermoanaerobaculia bacterium]
MQADRSAANVRILGLDPGSRHTGFGVIDQKAGRLQPVRFGRFSLPPKSDLASRLAELDAQLSALVDELEPTHAALETPFQGLNPRSLIILSQARGVLIAALARRRIPITEYTPTEVKSAVSGYGRAAKSQVGRMVCQILALGNEKPSEDAADALAVAICCANRSHFELLRTE